MNVYPLAKQTFAGRFPLRSPPAGGNDDGDAIDGEELSREELLELTEDG